MFNRYFHSIFTTSSFSLTELPKIYSSLSTITITQEEVYQTLVSLQPAKAAGCDGIGQQLLKSCALSLYEVFHHLFSLSLSQSYIPLEWRVHTIKPIHKSGDRTSVENYRPISLLCVSSKVLEKIIFKHIMAFLTTKISLYQFGFMHHRSTLQQLLFFVNYLDQSIGNSLQVDVIYLDFKKAFDSVAHNELLFKLWSIGLTGSV